MYIFPISSQPAALFIICLFSLLLAACDGNNPGSSAAGVPVVSAISPASAPLADATLTNISIAPASAVVSAENLTTFVANGIFSDGTTRNITNLVAWKSDRAAVASINNKGIAKAIGEGSGKITATLQNIVSAPASFTVAFSVGGNLTGLAADNRIILSNNGTDIVSLTANGAFSFPELLAKGSAYKLSIAALPINQPCTHTYGAGKVQATNMPGMNVFCGFQPRGETIKTSGLTVARRDHATTLLPDGKVLATGGVGSKDNLSSTELYDPIVESWTVTGALAVARRNHTATLLPNGKVLVVGGLDNAFVRLASAELFDPLTGQWSSADNLKTARSLHTATLLANGKVLITGGVGALGIGTLASAELYDPATGSWTDTGALSSARSLHTAMLLPNGKVLVSGGVGSANAGTLSSAELYDPATGRWTSTGNLNFARSQHSTTLMPNGQVLVAGGIGSAGNLASAELYNLANGRWSATGNLTFMRFLHTANLLPAGKVLVVGGVGADGNLARNELYDPKSGRWISTGNFSTVRSQHSATLLSNGKLLVTGGNGTGVLADAELYW